VAVSLAADLEFETLTEAAAFARLPVDEWDGLVHGLPHPSPYLLHGWTAAYLCNAPPGLVPRVHVAYRAGQLVAALPLAVSTHHGLKLADFAGGPQTVWGDLLLAENEPEATADRLLAAARHSDHDYAHVHGLAPDSRLARLGRLTLTDRMDAITADLTPGWDDVYRAKFSKRHRQDHRRKRRWLSELGTFETRIARSPAELEAVLEQTFRLHELRWRRRYDRSAYGSAVSREVVQDAVGRLGSRGQYRVVTIELDGRPIAFLSFFVVGDVGVGHRTAFDPAYARGSPGLLVFLDGLAHASETGLARFEFGTGDELFKRVLGDAVVRVYDGLGLATSRAGAVAAAANRSAIELRMRLRGSPALRSAYDRVRAAASRID